MPATHFYSVYDPGYSIKLRHILCKNGACGSLICINGCYPLDVEYCDTITDK